MTPNPDHRPTITPTRIGQRCRLVGHGGAVRAWHVEAASHPDGYVDVVRFTAAGNPVLRLGGPGVLAHAGRPEIEVVDTFGCARVLTDDGRLEHSEAP